MLVYILVLCRLLKLHPELFFLTIFYGAGLLMRKFWSWKCFFPSIVDVLCKYSFWMVFVVLSVQYFILCHFHPNSFLFSNPQ